MQEEAECIQLFSWSPFFGVTCAGIRLSPLARICNFGILPLIAVLWVESAEIR